MNYTRSDEKIRDQICEALTDDEHIDASNIDIVVKGGEVTLTGTVEDRRAKRLAEDIADRCSGVKDIQNQLKVSGDQHGRVQNGSVGKTDKNRA
jgi:osmotically-inducible protein OsmY